MEDTQKLLEEVTVENIKKHIADGLTSSHVIAKYVIGHEIWECLPEWDQKIITARVHRVIRENKLL